MSDSTLIKSRLDPSLTAATAPKPLPSRPTMMAELPGTFFTSPGFIMGLVALEFVYGFVLFIGVSSSKRQPILEPTKDDAAKAIALIEKGGLNVRPKVEPDLPKKESPAPAPKKEDAGKAKEPESPKKEPDAQAKPEGPKASDRAPVTQEPPKGGDEPPASKVATLAPTSVPAPSPPDRLVASVEKPQPKLKIEEPTLEPFGPLIDPDHDCKARRDPPDGFTIEVPGTLHVLSPELMRMNAPRALTEVVGDFDVRVHIPGRGNIRPGINPLAKLPFPPFQGEGLLLWHNEGNYIRLERTVLFEGGSIHQVMLESYKNGRPGRPVYNKASDEPMTLRIERHGSEFICSYSFDEKQWVPVRRLATGFPSKIGVGISASNISPKPFEARFTNFIIQKHPGK